MMPLSRIFIQKKYLKDFFLLVILNLSIGSLSANPVTPINPNLKHTFIAKYDAPVESPDSKHLIYVHFPKPPEWGRLDSWAPPEEGAKGAEKCELWVCEYDLTNHRKVCVLPGVTKNHDGADQFWLNNHLVSVLTFFDTSRYAISVVDINKNEVVWGPIHKVRGGHYGFNGKILLSGFPTGNDFDKTGLDNTEYGIWEVDVLENNWKLLITADDIFTAVPTLKTDPKVIPVKKWKAVHLQYSTDGSRVLFKLHPYWKRPRKALLMTMTSDGKELRQCYAKPLHVIWYDENTIMGVDDNGPNNKIGDKMIHRYNLNGKKIELLGGHANHISSTADRELFAGESYYGSKPISLNIYKKGETKPIKTVFTTKNTNIVWKGAAHIDPSFSKDKKRLYFNYPENDGTITASFIELDHH